MKILNLLFFFIIASIHLHAAVIKGNVSDFNTRKPLPAKITSNSGMTFYCNAEGNFRISNLDIGTYILEFSYPGYLPISDKIIIMREGQVQEINMLLLADTQQVAVISNRIFERVKIIPDSAWEEYHKQYENLDPRNVLKIRLDSIAISGEKLYAYSAFYNQLDIPLYIIKNSGFSIFARALALDGDKDTMRTIHYYFDSFGMTTFPSMQDLLVIPPHSKEAYPPIELADDFTRYLPGSYTIIIKYAYKKLDFIPYVYSIKEDAYRDQIYLYNITLRGEYVSENAIVFQNILSKRKPLKYNFLLEGKDSMQTKNLDK